MPFERPQTFFIEHGVRHSLNLGRMSLVFVQPGSKVDSIYYCGVVVNQGLLPDTQKLSGNYFTYQQDGVPAHCSRQTVAFLCLHVPEFVEPENWPPNSPDLNPVDYSIWGGGHYSSLLTIVIAFETSFSAFTLLVGSFDP